MEEQPKKVITPDGDIEWRLSDGRRHRIDGPAVIYKTGDREWYYHDKLHRIGGPAITAPYGDQFWYQHGKPHRDDGPAVTTSDGYQAWYHYGKFHRDNGPAIIRVDDTKEYWFNGHRAPEGSLTYDLIKRRELANGSAT
jgi:hypothetical protein